MPWFPVDDGFHSHPKTLATSLAARGLWATAGSWCSDPAHHSDGVVPAHVLESLGGTPELAAELVAAGFWRRTRKGYAFHDWFDWGSKRTARQQAELSAVRQQNGRKGGLASGQSRSVNGVHSAKQDGSNPGFASHTGAHTPGHDPPPDQGKGPSKPEANPKQVASPGLGKQTNPNTSTNKEPPNPPPSGGHDGSHPNCRACGTNPRGPAPEPKPTPMPPAFDEVHYINGEPLRGRENIRAAVERAAIAREDPT